MKLKGKLVNLFNVIHASIFDRSYTFKSQKSQPDQNLNRMVEH